MSSEPWALSPLMTSARTKTGSDEWSTPLELVWAIEAYLGLTFQLDACCSRGNGILTRMHLAGVSRPGIEWGYPQFNGLTNPWASYCRSDYRDRPGAVWVNPPYSDCASWIRKARAEGKTRPVVCLVPARTDTRWWTEHVMLPQPSGGESGAARILFVAGRVHFGGESAAAGNAAPFPSAIILFAPWADVNPRVESWRWQDTAQTTLV